MATLPSGKDLGVIEPRPAGGVAGYDTGRIDHSGVQVAAGQFGEAAQFLEKARQNDLELQIQDRVNKLHKELNEQRFNTETGWAKLQSENALGDEVNKKVTDSFDSAKSRISETITDERARQKFEQHAQISILNNQANWMQHRASQNMAFDKRVHDDRIANIHAGLDTNEVLSGEGMGNLMIAQQQLEDENRRYWGKNQGVNEDGLKALNQKSRDDLITVAVNRAAASATPLQAIDVFNKYKDQMSADQRGKLSLIIRKELTPIEAKDGGQKSFDAFKTKIPTPTVEPLVSNFDTVMPGIFKREGGFVAKDGASGAPANFGINQAANPDIDVSKLTKAQAAAVYKQRYWDAIGADNLSPAMQIAAMDAAVNMGPEVAKRFIAASGGDVSKMMELRKNFYDNLVQDPKYAKYKTAWENRQAQVQAEIEKAPKVVPAGETTRSMLLQAQEIPFRKQLLADAEAERPGDKSYSELRVSHGMSLLHQEIQGERGAQANAHQVLEKAAMGLESPQKFTSLPALLSSGPKLRDAWGTADAATQRLVNTILEQNLAPKHGSSAGFYDVWNKVTNPDESKRLTNLQELATYVSNKTITVPEYNQLKSEIGDYANPERSQYAKDISATLTVAHNSFAGNMALKSMGVDAMLWNEFRQDLQAKIKQNPKGAADYLTAGNDKYVLGPKSMAKWMQRGNEMAREQMAATSGVSVVVPAVKDMPKVMTEAELFTKPKGWYTGPLGAPLFWPGKTEGVKPSAPVQKEPPKDDVPKFAGSMDDLTKESKGELKAAIADASKKLLKSAASTVGTIIKAPDIITNAAIDTAAKIPGAINDIEAERNLSTLPAQFDEIAGYSSFTKEDIPIVKRAIESGKLSAAQVAKAKKMLASAGVK